MQVSVYMADHHPSKESMILEYLPAAGVVPMQLGEDEEEGRVLGAQFLLAALEACGVDNARIEIEGGHEVRWGEVW